MEMPPENFLNMDWKENTQFETPELLFKPQRTPVTQGIKGGVQAEVRGIIQTPDFLSRGPSLECGSLTAALTGAGKVGFSESRNYMLKKGEPAPNASGRVEWLENILNEYI